MAKTPIGVLASGGGTNLQSIIDKMESKDLNIEIKAVISNKENAYALQRAAKHNIPNYFINKRKYTDKIEFEKEILKILKKSDVELVVLAGFMTVLSPFFIKEYENRIINIHPSLIPAFCGKGYYGTKVHTEVIKYGVKYTGVTIHFVDEGTDTGPIILQKSVKVEDDDTPETLAKKVQREEHSLYPEAIKLFCENRLYIEGRKVRLK